MEPTNFVGHRFGALTVTAKAEPYRAPNGQSAGVMWQCICDCGVSRAIRASSLRGGTTVSCGCSKALKPIAERLWPRLVADGDCWLWTMAHNKSGHGRIWLDDRTLGYTHRVAYELMVGEIPSGLTLDHLCRRPPCCNPYHMEPVTRAVNTARGNRDAASERRMAAAP